MPRPEMAKVTRVSSIDEGMVLVDPESRDMFILNASDAARALEHAVQAKRVSENAIRSLDVRRIAAEALQSLLVARATGGLANADEYKRLRDQLLNDSVLHDRAPAFLRTSRDLDQFWAHIKAQSGQYASRRKYIWEAFAPLLDFLERGIEQANRGFVLVPPIESNAGPGAESEVATVRAFVSYSTRDKLVGAAVKNVLSDYGITCFLAHDDLEVFRDLEGSNRGGIIAMRLVRTTAQCGVQGV